MNPIRSISIAVLLALSTASAFSDGAKTRAQVRAELEEARRSGNIIGAGEAGVPLNQLFPSEYPAVGPTKTRAEVVEELAEARRSGDMLANGESGETLNEVYPQLYPAPVYLASATRAEVRAELAEARLLGDAPIGEDGLTPAQRHPLQYAKVRAAHADEHLASGQAAAPAR